jgi:hypothetical protein
VKETDSDVVEEAVTATLLGSEGFREIKTDELENHLVAYPSETV